MVTWSLLPFDGSFFTSLICKFLVDFKASRLSQIGHFVFYCPFKGGYFSSVDLEMDVRDRLRELGVHLREVRNIKF